MSFTEGSSKKKEDTLFSSLSSHNSDPMLFHHDASKNEMENGPPLTVNEQETSRADSHVVETIDFSTLAKTRLASSGDGIHSGDKVVLEGHLNRRKKSKRENRTKKAAGTKVTPLHIVLYHMLTAEDFKTYKYLSPNQFKYMVMFLGSEMAEWSENNLKGFSHKTACSLGQLFMDEGFIRAISDVEDKLRTTEIATFVLKNFYCVEVDPRKLSAVKNYVRDETKPFSQRLSHALQRLLKQLNRTKISKSVQENPMVLSTSPGLTRLQFIPSPVKPKGKSNRGEEKDTRKSMVVKSQHRSTDSIISNSSPGRKNIALAEEEILLPSVEEKISGFTRRRSNSLNQLSNSLGGNHEKHGKESSYETNLESFKMHMLSPLKRKDEKMKKENPKNSNAATAQTKAESASSKSMGPKASASGKKGKEVTSKKKWYRKFLGSGHSHEDTPDKVRSKGVPVEDATFLARGMTAPNQGGGDRHEDLAQPIRPKLTRIVYRHGQPGAALVPHITPQIAQKYFFLEVKDIDDAFLAQHHSKRDGPKISKLLPTSGFTPIEDHHNFISFGGPGPREGKYAYGDSLGCCSVSTYPRDPKAPERQQGVPICDCYMGRLYSNRALLVLSDGCSWGPRPRKAAFDAAEGFLQLAHKDIYKLKGAADCEKVLLNAVGKAHRNILRNKDTVWEAGTTTLVGGLLVEMQCDADVPEDQRPWGFFCVNVGDCKVYHYSKKGMRFVDVTAGNRVAVTDPCDPGGRLGPYVGKEGRPDLRNLMYYYQPCEVGDLLILVSDGVHDNLDPQILGLTPQQVGLDDEDWDIDDVSVITEAAKNRYRLRCLRAILGLYGKSFDQLDDQVEERKWNNLIDNLQSQAKEFLCSHQDGIPFFVRCTTSSSVPKLKSQMVASKMVDLLSEFIELVRRYAPVPYVNAAELEKMLWEGDDGLCNLQRDLQVDHVHRKETAQLACQHLDRLVQIVANLAGPLNRSHAPFTLPVYYMSQMDRSEPSDGLTPRRVEDSTSTESISSCAEEASTRISCSAETSTAASLMVPNPKGHIRSRSSVDGSKVTAATISNPRATELADFVRYDKVCPAHVNRSRSHSDASGKESPTPLPQSALQKEHLEPVPSAAADQVAKDQSSKKEPVNQCGAASTMDDPQASLLARGLSVDSLSDGGVGIDLIPMHIAELLCKHCVEVTAKSRWAMEQKDGRLLKDYSVFPGKMDHTTCMVMRVGRVESVNQK